MRNLLVLLTVITCSTFVSCSSGAGMSDTAKKNLEVNDAIMKAYEAGDFSKMGDYIAADAIDHGGENGDVKGLDSIIAMMKVYHAMMPDMKTIMTRSLADDEYVYTWAKYEMTMNGQKTTMTGVDISKFKDGKAVEHWTYMDPNEMKNMMPPPPPGADGMPPQTEGTPNPTP